MSFSTPSELRKDFTSAVPDDIEVGHPTESSKLDYEQYLDLDASLRSGDERPFVDTAFTPRLLTWLGYEEADWKYNDTTEGGSGDRPDFLVRPKRATAFIVEDKNTTEDFRAEHVEQLQKYTAGTQGYVLWTNARVVLALRFYPGGSYDILARVPVDTRQPSFQGADDTALALFHTLFEKDRFVEMPGILKRICLDEEEWKKVVRPLDNEAAQRKFIEETRELLDKLTLSALAQIERAAEDVREGKKDVEETVEQLKQQRDELLQAVKAGVSSDKLDRIRSRLDELLVNPGALTEEELRGLKPDHLGTVQEREWDSKAFALISTVADLRERQVQRYKSRKIHQSFEAWRDRYRIIEGDDMTDERRRNAYAEQVAYTFFIRLLLARILEDKGAVNRLISDGGLKAWREITEPSISRVKEDEVGLHGRALLDVLFQSISKFYQHFFNQPVFDWFNPDDYLLARALERLSTFSFADINRDILGFAYEAYVERAFRNEKGHFLTRGEIVEYILDEAEYEGREIIGRKVLDPAAGSGSFLVHAARRLRDEIENAVGGNSDEARKRVAQEFIRHLQDDFVGLEINPFSCYLTELNLLLQALDDLLYLWQDAETLESIEQFRIFNTDSLTLPQSVLQNEPTLAVDGATLGHDQAREVKLEETGSFDFVIMNPPYINRGIQHDLPDLTKIPFYNVLFGGGDTNYYHAFIRLANHYVDDGGVVALICPLQLYGDRSAGGIRQWLSAPLSGSPPDELPAEWQVQSLSRFYSRTVLFENVIQAVSVSVWKREKDLTEEQVEDIVVAGGTSIEEARTNRSRFTAPRVVATDPITARKRQKKNGGGGNAGSSFTDEWHHAWAVIADEERLKVWEQLRDASDTDLDTWTRRHDAEFYFRKGDVNMTRTKPLRLTSDGGQVQKMKTPVPTSGSKDLIAYGPYTQSSKLDADADVGAMAISKKKKDDADRERRDRVARIANLSETEAVCVIKEISGIEPARPIRGSLYHRGGSEPLVCFEDTLQVIFTPHAKHQYLTEAIFALLISSTANFIFSLFSTNQHVGTYEIQRLPIPNLQEDQLQILAQLGNAVQQAGEDFWNLKKQYGASGGLMELAPDPEEVLSHSGVKTESLATARLRGHITIDGPDYHVSTLLERGNVAFPEEAKHPDYADAAKLFLARTDEKRKQAGNSVSVPEPGQASAFLKALSQAKQEIEQKQKDFFQALAALDRYVLSLYNITSLETCELVGAGMPWASTGREWAQGVSNQLSAVKPKKKGLSSPAGAAPTTG